MKSISHVAAKILFIVCCLSLPRIANSQAGLSASDNEVVDFVVEVPTLVLQDIKFETKIYAVNKEGVRVRTFSDSAIVKGINLKNESGPGQPSHVFQFEEGVIKIPNTVLKKTGKLLVTVESQTTHIKTEKKVRVIPGILSLLPPIFAISLAFIARQVLISLFLGIWLGSLFIYDYNPVLGFMKTIDTYLIDSLADPDHASILIFSLTLGGMVGVISKAGGTQGIVEKLSKYANNPRGGQLATWAMGLLIFFDDYANTLIVGNTMRPFTDRLRISREKLSYIVDSTAAPVASIAMISTWIGFQIGLIDQAFTALNLSHNAYSIFLQSIPYATYSVLAVIFVFLIGFSLRDFGPMRTAELRAAESGKVLRDGAQPITDSASLEMAVDKGTPLRWYNAIIPITVVILVTLVGLYVNGKQSLGTVAQTATLGQIFGAANSFAVLMWASFSGLSVAIALAIVQRILNLNETINAAVNGYKSMILAAMILILAWAIGDICKDLHTADYVIELSKGILSPHLIPFVTFAVSAFISFSTGSSWATMAILTPIVVPIAYKLPLEVSMDANLGHQILIATVGAILSGSVLGDHCSPISDTTILSSMASAADHVDHVRTQMPYAILVGVVASLTGYIPHGWGFNTYLSLFLGTIILAGIIFVIGKKSKVMPIKE